ncbi:hypothetical protein [Actinomadura sp. DC4]|uniref:hypothetical protein n=1 Tax=Actinomadura sp. DC4 TaxID=3055069 RepID=UPI0025B00AAB|nr:hypothetical protein [Actinomadura sp. DC4]MDN3356052.1 hypothetical protein [Actinomadura sp. DC4]
MTAPTFTQPEAGGTQLGQPGADGDDAIAGELKHIILDASRNAPRSRQSSIGPSEIGAACDRRLAYKILDWDKANTGGDPLASILGTGYHNWAEAAFSRPELGGRWLVEQRLTIAPPLIPGGSCDLYDTLHDRVIDWKVVGDSMIRKYKAEGPRREYRVQGHTYGLGWELAGYRPKEVVLAVLPRTGYLSGMWIWREPYDRQIALDAIARIYAIRDLIVAIDPEANPPMWELIPAVPSFGCKWCPWFKPASTDLGAGCPGNVPPKTRTRTNAAKAA